MRKLLAVALVLLAVPGAAQSPVNVVEHNLTAARALPARLSDGSGFIVPVLDTTLTARFPVGSTPGDNESNAVTITRSGAFAFVWDGATWDRWTGAVSQSGTWNVGTVATITNPVAVTGTFWQATQPVSIATMPSTPVTGTFWQATQPISGTVTANVGTGTQPVSGTFWQATQPISGTVAATQSGTWTAQPGNTPNTVPWLTSIHDGTTKAAVFNLAANDPLSVAIVDGTGTQITSFGGGTQYTETDTDASIAGTAVMWEDAGDALRAVSAAKPLPVNVVAGGAGDGSILDGVSSAIKATVHDYTNSNPLAVVLRDTNGDYVSVGGGTQYVEFDATAATPTGTYMLVRDAESGTNRYIAPAADSTGKLFTHPQNSAHETLDFKLLDFDTVGTDLRAATGVLLPASGGAVIGGTATAPFRVDTTGTTTQPVSGAVTVSGTVTANAGTGTLAVSGPVTDTQLRATPVPVSGTVTANVGTGTQAVSGTFWQTTQPVSIEQTGNNNAVDVLTMPTTTVQATDLDIRNLTATDVVTVSQATASSLNATVVQATGTNLHTVVDSGTVTTVTNLTNLPNEGQQTAANSISVAPDTDNDAIGATGAAPPGEVVDIGGRASGADTTGLMAGITVCTEHVAVDIVTATTTLVVTGVANRHVRICSLSLVTAAANNVALIAGTGATCGTSTAGINGGVTAAEGWNFAANGGLTQGSGLGEIMSTKVTGGATGDSVCIITSAATQLSGTIAYALY